MEINFQPAAAEAARRWFLTDASGTSSEPSPSHLKLFVHQSSVTPVDTLPDPVARALALVFIVPKAHESVLSEIESWPEQVRTVPSQRGEASHGWQTDGETLYAHHIKEIEDKLQITRSQMAKAFSVERATLYKWLKGSKPRRNSCGRLKELREIANEWHRAGMGPARAAWDFRAPGSKATLGSLLCAETMEREQIREFIQAAMDSPETLQFVGPSIPEAFPAESVVEQKRRESEVLPTTYHVRD
jgi:DNA-binding transcriptional regulator YiaG